MKWQCVGSVETNCSTCNFEVFLLLMSELRDDFVLFEGYRVWCISFRVVEVEEMSQDVA